MTQYLLFCSKIPNTLSDVQESIKSDVRPQDAVLRGTEVENSLSNQFGEDDNNVSKSSLENSAPKSKDVNARQAEARRPGRGGGGGGDRNRPGQEEEVEEVEEGQGRRFVPPFLSLNLDTTPPRSSPLSPSSSDSSLPRGLGDDHAPCASRTATPGKS